MYADMEEDQCNQLDFQLGGTEIDATFPQNRQWNIKVYRHIKSYQLSIFSNKFICRWSSKNTFVSCFGFPDHSNRMQLRP